MNSKSRIEKLEQKHQPQQPTTTLVFLPSDKPKFVAVDTGGCYFTPEEMKIIKQSPSYRRIKATDEY